uniref:Uncharacterized protein n=1 Tax=Bionectria ochroleuca TaxID=29856 RepID=A0A8H7N1X5_BIOOC
MSQLLLEKVIIITGASQGIGRAIAIECAQNGALLVIHHIGDSKSQQDVEALLAEISAIGNARESAPSAVHIGLDVTLPDAGKRLVDLAVSTFGRVDGIVHNAGIAQFIDFGAVTKQQLDKHLSVNFGGPFAITQAVTSQMIAQDSGGSVVSIASVTATTGSSQLAHYAATKAAVLGMTVNGAVALGKHGIRFNAVSPGTITTSINEADLAGPKRAAMEGRVPLGRLGVPVDIAKPVVFFLSDMAQYVSGQNLIVDGAATVFYQ